MSRVLICVALALPFPALAAAQGVPGVPDHPGVVDRVRYELLVGSRTWDPSDGDDDASVRYAHDGFLELETSRDADGHVILRDRLTKGDRRRYDALLVCRPGPGYAPLEARIDWGRDRVVHWTVTNADAWVRMGGEAVHMPFPTNLLTQSALYRLLPALPADTGSVHRFEAFAEVPEFGPGRPDEGCTITCTGVSTVQWEGVSLPCTRYEFRGGRRMDAWVDPTGRLLRIHDRAGIRMELRDASREARPLPEPPAGPLLPVEDPPPAPPPDPAVPTATILETVPLPAEPAAGAPTDPAP